MAISVEKLSNFLDERVPRSLSCSWDNDGLLCCPDPKRIVRRVLIALDVTEKTVNMAIHGEYDLLLTHHPLIFRPIKALTPMEVVPRKLLKLSGAGVSAIALHTRLDALDGGVNDALAAALDLPIVDRFLCEDSLEGRLIELPQAVTLFEFTDLVKRKLNVASVNCADAGKSVKKIGLLGGEGGDFIRAAKKTGCDTYLTGRAGYHVMLDAAESGINVIEAGHFYTEIPVCGVLADLIHEADQTLTVDICSDHTMQIF